MAKKKLRAVSWLLPTALCVLLLANLAVIVYVGADALRTRSATADGKATTIDGYKERVDNLNRLVTALIGLSTLYTVVLGTTVYLSAQVYVERLKELLKDARQKSDDHFKLLETRFPVFRNMDATIAKMIGLLQDLIPDRERIEDHFPKLTIETQERVLYFERSAAFFEFLNLNDVPNSDQVFRRLSRFYRALYEKEKKDGRAAGALHFLERAKIYIDRGLQSHPRDFASMNELANIIQEEEHNDLSEQARIQFEASARVQPRQQRALYWLGYIALEKGKLDRAEEYFTLALNTDIWEIEKSSPERTWDLHYNRACTRSRKGMNAVDQTSREKLKEGALSDLDKACPAENKSMLKSLLADIEPDQDLEWLKAQCGPAVQSICDRLR